MNKQGINEAEIQIVGMERTIACCVSELRKQKQMRRQFPSMIKKLIWLDLHMYIKWAFLGLFICLFGSWASMKNQFISESLYFAFLSLFAVYEMYQHRQNQMQEYLRPTCTHETRLFLYKGVALAVVQFMIFTGVCAFEVFIFGKDSIGLFLYAWIPMFLLQGIAVVFERYVSGQATILLLYAFLYFGYQIIVWQFFQFLLAHSFVVVLISVVMIILYGCCFFGKYQYERRLFSWN